MMVVFLLPGIIGLREVLLTGRALLCRPVQYRLV